MKIEQIVSLADEEKVEFRKIILATRKKLISPSDKLVEEVLDQGEIDVDHYLKQRNLSGLIGDLRERVWQKFLVEEAEFNTQMMKDLYRFLERPAQVLDQMVIRDLTAYSKDELFELVKQLCGEYSGRVFPYIYELSLSNTNSRRSRSGKTFEAIIYKMYSLLNYPFESQGKVGRKIFSDVGLGKKVDSVLPGIEFFKQRRNKTIIGTMKTSLRERWQEVAEEIERTKIPEIHLLTVDEDISASKAAEMSKHNIVVVVYDNVKALKHLKGAKNIVSFEEYFYEEIPNVIKFWND